MKLITAAVEPGEGVADQDRECSSQRQIGGIVERGREHEDLAFGPIERNADCLAGCQGNEHLGRPLGERPRASAIWAFSSFTKARSGDAPSCLPTIGALIGSPISHSSHDAIRTDQEHRPRRKPCRDAAVIDADCGGSLGGVRCGRS